MTRNVISNDKGRHFDIQKLCSFNTIALDKRAPMWFNERKALRARRPYLTQPDPTIMQEIFTNSATPEEVRIACDINKIKVDDLFEMGQEYGWLPGIAVVDVLGAVDLNNVQSQDDVEIQAKASVSEIKILHNYSVRMAQRELGHTPAKGVIKMVGDIINNRTKLTELEAMVYKVDIGKSSNLSAYLKFKEETLGYEAALKELMEEDPDEQA